MACRAKLFTVAGVPRAAGSIWKGDLSTGKGEIVVEDAGGMVAGMTYDKRSGYLYVCGGSTGEGNLCVAVRFTKFRKRRNVPTPTHCLGGCSNPLP